MGVENRQLLRTEEAAHPLGIGADPDLADDRARRGDLEGKRCQPAEWLARDLPAIPSAICREGDDDMNSPHLSIGGDSRRSSGRFTRQTVTIPEAAAILGLPRSTAYELANEGVIPTLRLGRRKLVSRAVLYRMLCSDDAGRGLCLTHTMHPDTDSRAAAA